MFELEKAISQWRRSLRKNEALEDGYIAELESHLRDEIEHQISLGLTEQEAFEKAVACIGQTESLGTEFYKSHTRRLTGRPPWKPHRFMPDLIWNYFKIAFRKIRRQKGYSFINVVGLAIGMACSILILLWIQDELSYDRFHDKANQIYRVTQVRGAERRKIAYTAPSTAQALLDDFPEVLSVTRIDIWPTHRLVSYEEKKFLEKGIIEADPSIFDVFMISFIRGNPKTALVNPDSIVITEKTAEKYFGDEDPIGKILVFNRGNAYKVTGVVRNYPRNSHFNFDMILPLVVDNPHWRDHCLFTYIVLQEKYPPSKLEAKFPDFILRNWGSQFERETGSKLEDHLKKEENYYGFWLQSLTDIHLKSTDITDNSKTKGDIVYVYIFSIIALFVLIIACINFINLSTARSANRTKEVGLRKVVGSSKSSLIRQFLVESVVLSFISLFFALIIVEATLPAFCNLVERELSVGYFKDPLVLPGLLFLALFVGLMAGAYPAFYLSSFQPVAVLKGKLKSGTEGKMLRNVLVGFQYTISIFILISTFVVFRQLKYVQNAKLGLNKEQVLVIHRANSLGKKGETFKQELLRYPGIKCVSNTSSLPGRHFNANSYRLEGTPATEKYTLYSMYADQNLAELLDLEIVDGRFFSREIASDSHAIVINETAVRRLGLTAPVGKRFHKEYGGAKEEEFAEIIGVLKDIHFHSLHDKIAPMAFRYFDGTWGFYTSVRIEAHDINETIKFIEKTWNDLSSEQPFVYSFLDDDFDSLYRAEQKTGKIFILFSILSVFIACLGILGLVSFMTEQRTKEIGIRKVLGASVSGIVLILSKQFTRCVLFANVIAWPAAYYFTHKWLQGFAYRISIGWGVFVFSAAIALIIAVLSVSVQTIKAATMNPVDCLRYE